MQVKFSIYYYATAATEKSTYILGGRVYDNGNLMIDDIWEYTDTSRSEKNYWQFWAYRGALRRQKNGHSAITIGEETHVFGGLGT